MGAGVRGLKPKDRVAIYSVHSCGVCGHCHRGDWTLCNDARHIGAHFDGGFAEYVAAAERNCFILPDDLSYEQGALVGDCVGTQNRALKRLGVNGRHTVALFGLGPVGLGMLLLLKRLNCTVLAVEISQYRKNMGRELGTDMVIDPNADDPINMINEHTDGQGADVAIDCAGTEITENLALDCVKKGGKVGFVGQNRQASLKPSAQFIRKELTVIGSLYYSPAEYEEILSLIRGGLGVEKVLTHNYDLEDAQEAFSVFAKGESGKVNLVPYLNS